MRRRRFIVAALALLLLAGVVVATVVLARRPSPRAAPVSPQQALSSARTACAAADELQRLVERNARLDQVRSALHRAEQAAQTAARGDARWQALDGGVKSLRIGIDANDERVTRTGVGVVRAECGRLAQLP